MDKKLKNLKDVMAVQTTSYNVKLMNKYIREFVKNIPDCKLYKNHGNLYVTRGNADIYPCVVAHTDTVHDIHKEFYVQRHKDVLYAINGDYERVGIGGDDKVGVFVALEILRTTPNCKVAFFRDEEVGCVGSKVADMTFFKDVAFVLQCDRQGYADFVNEIFYETLFTDEFSQAIAPLLDKYGKVESDGGMTDVWQLAENGLDVCCANMSCGYYDPHTDNEYIKINEVMATLSLVKEICESFGDKKWEITDRGGYYSNYGSYGGYGKSKDKYGYRRYGGGIEHVSRDAWDDWDGITPHSSESHENDWAEDNEVREATCTICNGKEKVCYDDSVDAYWCYGCEDYIREEMLEFDGNVDPKLLNAYDDSEDDNDDVPF